MNSSMKIKELVKNGAAAFASQGVSFLLSILVSLLVPKVLGVEEYGYWQLFIFYSSYTGFFTFGLADGVYLVEGGASRNTIDKRKVNSSLWLALAYEIPIAIVVVLLCALMDFGQEREFVISATAAYFVISSSWSSLGFVFQAMNETRLYSFAVMANKIAFLIPLIALLLSGCASFEPFVVCYALSHCCSLLYCVWKGRDFLAAGLCSLTQTVRVSLGYIRVGVKLMLANIASTLILGVARFLIDAEWGIATFGRLSFSLSMVNFFLAFVSQASMVLFPALRQSNEDERLRIFSGMRDTLTILLPAAYLLCFPLIWLIGLWLPQYQSCLHYFVYLLPLCVFDGKMNLLGTTYFKVLREESTLLKVNVATAALSLVGTLIGIYILQSIDAVICAVVIALAFRSLLSEEIISKKIGVETSLLPVGETLISIGFVATSSLLPTWCAIVVYALMYFVFLAVYRRTSTAVFGRLINLRKNLGKQSA